MKKCLIINVSGTFARFRKPYTTTSALSFMCIHPLAAKGLLGAILGVEKENLYSYFKDTSIGLQVITEIRKDMGSYNLISNVVKNGALRFPSNVEFLRDVKYRLFIHEEEQLLQQLKKVIEARQFVFTPYLGASEHIAHIEVEQVEEVNNSVERATCCVIPKQLVELEDINISKIYTDKLPIRNNEKREYTAYEQVIIPVGYEVIKVKSNCLYQVGGEHVYFF